MKRRFVSLLLALALVLTLIPAVHAEEAVSQDPFEEICEEFDHAITVEPYQVEVAPTRTTGWADLLWAPTEWSPVMTWYINGETLTVLKETPNWLLAKDEETGDIGYIRRSYTTAPRQHEETGAQISTDEATGKTDLGYVDANGYYLLRGKIPAGYTAKIRHAYRDQLVVEMTSEDAEMPYMLLSVAYDEAFGQIARMNDMDDDALTALENTFTQVDPTVSLSFGDTGLGTRLLVAGQNDGFMDYMNVMSIYQGYMVEIIMLPGEAAGTMKEADLDLCVQVLTDLDFVGAEESETIRKLAGQPCTVNLTAWDSEKRTVTAQIFRLSDPDSDDPVLEVTAEVTLEVTDATILYEDTDTESGEPLETPKEISAEEFIAEMETGMHDFALENMRVLFDENGTLIWAERLRLP